MIYFGSLSLSSPSADRSKFPTFSDSHEPKKSQIVRNSSWAAPPRRVHPTSSPLSAEVVVQKPAESPVGGSKANSLSLTLPSSEARAVDATGVSSTRAIAWGNPEIRPFLSNGNDAPGSVRLSVTNATEVKDYASSTLPSLSEVSGHPKAVAVKMRPKRRVSTANVKSPLMERKPTKVAFPST